MALTSSRLGETITRKARTTLGIRFGRFAVVAILWVATKFAYHAATWLGLSGVERVLFVDLVYGVANLGTFVLRFLFFHYVLFAGSPGRPAPAVAEEALVSTDPGPEPFVVAAESTGPMRALPDDEDPPEDVRRAR